MTFLMKHILDEFTQAYGFVLPPGPFAEKRSGLGPAPNSAAPPDRSMSSCPSPRRPAPIVND